MRIKRETRITSIVLLILLSLIVSSLFGQSIPDRPNPPKLVNDLAKILTPQQRNTLENKLVRFNDTTSNQITVVIVNSLDGYTPSMFAFELGHQWKVGQKEFDNGIVLLVKPKLSSQDRGHAYIAVGYGLEPAIPDVITKRIIENEMIPFFKNGDYYGGINQATNVLMKLASGEISSDGYAKKSAASSIFSFLPFIIIIIIILLIRASNAKSHSISTKTSFWTALWLGSALSNSSHSGSWDSFSSGGSSGFGGGGGGFGGFGGGSFGGGGAGGSW